MFYVLILCEYPTLHGGERSMLSTLDAVRQAGFAVTVAAPPEGALAEAIRRQGVELAPLAFCDAAGKRLPQDRLREQLATLIRNLKPDLLHANSLSMGRLAGPVAHELHVPGIAHLRDIVGLSRQAIADLNCNTRLLAVSEATQQFHVERGLSAEKTHVLHNGVDLDRFRPRPKLGYLHRELNLPADAMLAGTIGQISLRKGQDLLIQAARLLSERLPRLHFLIVGQRFSEKAESRRFEDDLYAAAGSSLAGRLHLLGTRDDVDRLLGELTLLVHPARQEPLGRVLLEAAAAGVAVVATEVGGTPEIFPPECQAAQLVPAGDADALAAAILRVADDAPFRARLAAAARRRAAEAFDAKLAATGLIEHYRQVVGGLRNCL